MEAAIADGDLQSFLEAVDPNSPVYVVGVDEGGNRDIVVSPEDKGLSGGAISGIILGSMATVLLTLGLLAARRKSDEVEKTDDTVMKDRLQLEEMEELNGLDTPQASNVPDKGSFLTVAAVAATAGAASRDPRERQDSDAGSSGWSSREGLSSVDEDSKTSHSTSAGVGNPETEQDENSSYSESSLHLTYTELDYAIQKGDWAAVGGTYHKHNSSCRFTRDTVLTLLFRSLCFNSHRSFVGVSITRRSSRKEGQFSRRHESRSRGRAGPSGGSRGLGRCSGRRCEIRCSRSSPNDTVGSLGCRGLQRGVCRFH